jgi:hypothetical protein
MIKRDSAPVAMLRMEFLLPGRSLTECFVTVKIVVAILAEHSGLSIVAAAGYDG